MFDIQVNGQSFQVDSKKNQLLLNDQPVNWDIQNIDGNRFHIIYNLKSYNAEVVSLDSESKTAVISINGNIYNLSAKDQYDLLLHKLGLDNVNAHKAQDVKAPMPGLVLKVLVNAGDSVKAGDSLLVLEAMKMENVIKALGDGTVKSIKVKQGDKVEKNQVMIHFA